jgi:hypothetical protein
MAIRTCQLSLRRLFSDTPGNERRFEPWPDGFARLGRNSRARGFVASFGLTNWFSSNLEGNGIKRSPYPRRPPHMEPNHV